MTDGKNSVVVEFSMYPVNTVHFSGKLAKVVEELDRSGLEYQVGPMSTSLRGEWDEVMAAIRACHQALRKESERVITTVTIDDRREEQHDLKKRVELVDHQTAG